MIAQNLNEVIRLFNPRQALFGESLRQYYIQREHSPLAKLRTVLTSDTSSPQKIIFTGHRGSGKTTELACLANMVRNDFFVVTYAAEGNLDLWDLDHIQLLLALAGAIFQTGVREQVAYDKHLLQHTKVDPFVKTRREAIFR